ncbi:hypothetical protein BS330_03930 [Amycolatopsis keratiniphila subsp. nogabecina]|nr:hypothetical protein BS330_03930 [Amycolatopsis keratiniphila subsp. nogabecina]SDU53818.1 hypothetical protein SAMN04489733_5694 [Amycolatopsis keratiniphila]
MTNTGPWSIACRDVNGREGTLCVAVRDSEVVVVAPPGESSIFDYGAAAKFRSAVMKAAEVAATPVPITSGAVTTTDTASTAEQNLGGLPLTAEGRPALSPCRGGTMTPRSGPAAIPASRGEDA